MQPGSLVTDIVYKLSYVKRVFWSPHTFLCHIVEVLTFKQDIIIIFPMHCSKAVNKQFKIRITTWAKCLKLNTQNDHLTPINLLIAAHPNHMDVSIDLHLFTDPKHITMNSYKM